MISGWLAICLLVVAGCGGSTATAASPPCEAAPASELPQTQFSIGDGDAGHTFCLAKDQTLAVVLHVPIGDAASRWTPVGSSNSSVLEPQPNGALTLVRGVTANLFVGRQKGTTMLTATRPGATWSARVVVR